MAPQGITKRPRSRLTPSSFVEEAKTVNRIYSVAAVEESKKRVTYDARNDVVIKPVKAVWTSIPDKASNGMTDEGEWTMIFRFARPSEYTLSDNVMDFVYDGDRKVATGIDYKLLSGVDTDAYSYLSTSKGVGTRISGWMHMAKPTYNDVYNISDLRSTRDEQRNLIVAFIPLKYDKIFSGDVLNLESWLGTNDVVQYHHRKLPSSNANLNVYTEIVKQFCIHCGVKSVDKQLKIMKLGNLMLRSNEHEINFVAGRASTGEDYKFRAYDIGSTSDYSDRQLVGLFEHLNKYKFTH